MPPSQKRLRPESIGEDQKSVPYGTFFCTHLPAENFLVNGLAQVNETAIRPHGQGTPSHLQRAGRIFLGSGVQAVSCGAASESSPRRQPWGSALKGKSRGAAKELFASFLSTLPGLRLQCAASHGLRRGLLSDATPWLGQRREERFAWIEEENNCRHHNSAYDQNQSARTKNVFRTEHFFAPICRGRTSW